MSTPSPIDEYIRRFRQELAGVWWRRRRAIVAEVRGHLEDAAAEERTRGTEPGESERLAVASFGDSADVAAGFQPGPWRGRWLAVAAIGTVVLIVAIAQVVNTRQPSPTVVAVREDAFTGPDIPIVAATDPGQYQLPYSEIASIVPAHLPAPPSTGCGGSIMEFQLSDGRTVRYTCVEGQIRKVQNALIKAWNRSGLEERKASASELESVRTSQRIHPATSPARVVGGTAAQRRLISALARRFPMPGAIEIRIADGYRVPNGTRRGAIYVLAPASRGDARVGWAFVANEWAGSGIQRAYAREAKRRHLPPLEVLFARQRDGTNEDPFQTPPLYPPAEPYTLAGLRRDVAASAKANDLVVVRVALVHLGGWNAYVEVRTTNPRTASRLAFGRPNAGGLTSSLVLIDNPCGTPIGSLGGYGARTGTAWFDPTWYEPGFGTGMGDMNNTPALMPRNPCF